MSAVTIRDARLEDAERILEIYTYYVENTAISFECQVPPLSEFQDRMRKTMRRYPYLVVEQEGRIQGYAYAGAFVGRAFAIYNCIYKVIYKISLNTIYNLNVITRL